MRFLAGRTDRENLIQLIQALHAQMSAFGVAGAWIPVGTLHPHRSVRRDLDLPWKDGGS
jgi:hypothetical protein